MQPSRALLVLPLLLAAPAAGAGDLSFQVDSSKVSEFQGKAFTLQEAPGFGGSAAGFDKAFRFGSSDWTDRRADLGGRGVYAPDAALGLGKAFAVPQTSLFQGASPFSGQEAPFAMTDAKLPMDASASLPRFGTPVPYSDKAYAGPENDRLRAALGQLLDKEPGIATPDPLRPAKNDALHKQLNQFGGHIGPIITVEDVKGLIDKDVAPLPSSAAPEPAGPGAGAPGATAAAGPVPR